MRRYAPSVRRYAPSVRRYAPSVRRYAHKFESECAFRLHTMERDRDRRRRRRRSADSGSDLEMRRKVDEVVKAVKRSSEKVTPTTQYRNTQKCVANWNDGIATFVRLVRIWCMEYEGELVRVEKGGGVGAVIRLFERMGKGWGRIERVRERRDMIVGGINRLMLDTIRCHVELGGEEWEKLMGIMDGVRRL